MPDFTVHASRDSRKNNSVEIDMGPYSEIKTFWNDICTAIRTVAKKDSRYHVKIASGLSGRDDSGNKIPIDTIGKWLFGTPGFKSRIIRSSRVDEHQHMIITIWFPKLPDLPEIKALLESISKEDIRMKCICWGNKDHSHSWIANNPRL